MVNLNFIKTFILLSENLSFSKTAKILNTSQPVISRQIKVLEEQLNTTLFLRTKKKVLLTEMGSNYVKKFSPIINQLEGEIIGVPLVSKIQIGSLFEVGETFFMPVVMNSLKKVQSEIGEKTRIKIHLNFNSAVQIYSELLDGKVDLILTYLESQHKSIVSHKVMSDRAILVSSKDFDLKKELAHGLKYVSYREMDLFTQSFMNKNFKKVEVDKMLSVFSVNSHKSMIDYVSENSGVVAVVPLSSYSGLNDKKNKILIKDANEYGIFIQYHDSQYSNKTKMKLINCLIQEFKLKKIFL